MKGISEFFFGIILFLFFLNINFIIPIVNLTIPAYDIIVIILISYFTLCNSRQKMIYGLNGNYLKFVCFSLICISILIFLSIVVGLFIYGDIILVNDLFSIIAPLRLLLYIIVGAHLASMDYKILIWRRGFVLSLLLFGAIYSISISLIQFLYIIGFTIPIISDFSMSLIPERYYNLRVVGPVGNPNWNSFDLNLIAVISFALLRAAINKKSYKLMFGPIMLITFLLFLIFITFSRTGIITLFSLIFLFLYTTLKKAEIQHFLAIFILFLSLYKVGSILIDENKDKVNKRIESTLKIQEAGQRAHLWSSRIEITSKRFPFGAGPSRNNLLDIVDSQLVLTYGDSGFFGLLIYLSMVLYLIFKPLSLLKSGTDPYISILLFIVISLGIIMFNYSVTTEFLRNMRASSILLMLHSFFYYKVILLRNKTYFQKVF